MSEPTASESTELLSPPQQPQYVFGSSLVRKRRLRQFQCCLCAILIVGLLAALVITVAFTMHLPSQAINSTIAENETNVDLPDSFIVLFETQNWPLPDQPTHKSSDTNAMDLSKAMTQGQIYLDEKDAIEKNTASLPIDSPSYRHQKVMGTNERARNITRKGLRREGAARFLLRKHRIENTTLCPENYTDSFLVEMCSDGKSNCNRFHKYRTFNGSCNNLLSPFRYGVAYRPFRRALRPDYADGISQPRVSKSGGPLPTARTVSLEVHRPYRRTDRKFTVMLAVWGQFLDHDITATALSQKQNGGSISCCPVDGVVSPDCFPVIIDQDDPFSEYNVTCMEFVRSAPSPTCCLGPREQLNQASAFIDGSVIYGNDADKADSLRTMKGGLLKMLLTEDNRTLLPISEDMNDGCNREEERSKGRYCFATGDARANENLHLTSMHLIWARQHNAVAKNLSSINPHWDDERIFQEARRIVGAQMQHITYNEFLPILIGNGLMRKHNLSSKPQGFSTEYNESVDSSIANEFAAAAFRFAHTLIPSLVRTYARDSSSSSFTQMRKMLFNPFSLYEGGQLDGSLKGAMNTSIEASDRYFSSELKSHLFERTDQSALPKICGLDLVSLNIQRGRDHGLPGYVKWKEHCGMARSTTFDQLGDVIDPSSLANIRAIYRDVEDIDLYTGALSERPMKDAILGPTLTCLILDQFSRLKFGDRFWYENSENPQRFSQHQLDEIRKTTLARVICDCSDNLDVIQPRVMEGLSEEHDYSSCSTIPAPDLRAFKESFKRPVMQPNIDVVT